jgi:iron complex transport system substrate-binding protein
MKKTVFLIIFLWGMLFGTAFSGTPERIVSLAPSITEILFDLGLGKRVVGVTTFCDYPPQAADKPKIGGFANPSLEAVVSAKPDIVVLTDDGNPKEIYCRLMKLGIKTHVFRAKRLRELPKGIRDLGIALGIKDRAFEKAYELEMTLRRYEKKLFKSRLRYFGKKVIFIVHPEPLVVAGPGTVIDDALNLLGLKNIASDTGSRYTKYSVEELMHRSPDIILIGQGPMSGKIPDSLLEKLNRLEAVRKGRVYLISESLYRIGSRVITGIKEIEHCLDSY